MCTIYKVYGKINITYELSPIMNVVKRLVCILPDFQMKSIVDLSMPREYWSCSLVKVWLLVAGKVNNPETRLMEREAGLFRMPASGRVADFSSKAISTFPTWP